jgi:hypothetical protein
MLSQLNVDIDPTQVLLVQTHAMAQAGVIVSAANSKVASAVAVAQAA